MENLQREELHRRDGIEHALAPNMADRCANFMNQLRAQELADVGLDLPHGGEDTTSILGLLLACVVSTRILTGGRGFDLAQPKPVTSE